MDKELKAEIKEMVLSMTSKELTDSLFNSIQMVEILKMELERRLDEEAS